MLPSPKFSRPRRLTECAAAALALFLAPAVARAGDILRGSPGAAVHGTSAGADTAAAAQAATAATAATSQQAQTSLLAARAQSSLMTATAALHAQQSAQAAARALAAGANAVTVTSGTPPVVPDGLAVGGLNPSSGLQVNGTPTQAGVANPVSWVNASTPTQSTPDAGGRTTVTVVQTGEQALLTWQTFNNVGPKTTLFFDQSAGGANVGDWVAINKVAAGIAPSQILGSISAPGQVYVINQNGIIFGGASQVNVGALVVSSLPINDNLVNRGLLNNPDLQFLFSQLDISSGTQGPTPAFQPQENSPAPTGGVVARVDGAGNLSLVPASAGTGTWSSRRARRLPAPRRPSTPGERSR